MDKKTFPFKTLIWALLAVAALFLFKQEVSHLLNHSEEIKIFGIEFKASKEQIVELLEAQKMFEEQKEKLMGKIRYQEKAMDSLNILTANLAGQIQGCQGAKTTALEIDSSLSRLKLFNKNMKQEKFLLEKFHIIETNSIP